MIRENRPDELNPRLVIGPNYNFKDCMNSNKVFIEKLPQCYLAEYLNRGVMDWAPEVLIGIFVPTGAGKNYFVEHEILSYAKYKKTKVLHVGNRVALNRQVKWRLAAMFGKLHELEDASEREIDKMIEFGFVTVVSFQQIESWMNSNSPQLKKLREEFGYVIIDEAHYFVADSSFNAMSDIALKFITKNYEDSIKIYLTATPETAFPAIKVKEAKNGSNKCGPIYKEGRLQGYAKWHIYTMDPDFSWIKPKAFNHVDDLIQIIKKSDKDEKTIVFIDDKMIGDYIIKRCGFGKMLTADSKKSENPSYSTYKEIVETEKFSDRLLVCTAVLENGVNIKDSSVKNVAIFSNNKTRFIQMLGRVRRAPEQKIELFVQNETRADVGYFVSSLEKQLSGLKMYKADPTKFCNVYVTSKEPPAKVTGAFTVLGNGMSHVNELREIEIEHYELPFWLRIYTEMENDENALLREKFAWIGAEFKADDVIDKVGYVKRISEFTVFLKDYQGHLITKAEQEEFSKDFTTMYVGAFGRRAEDKGEPDAYGLNVMKKCLTKHEFPFTIVNQRGGWMVVSTEEGDDENES